MQTKTKEQTKTKGQIKKEVRETVEFYSNLLNIKNRVGVGFVKGNGIGGRYFKPSHKVKFNKTIFKTWERERRAWEFCIAHELVHAKYQDPAYGIPSLLPKYAVKNAFKELRANTIAYQVTNYTPEELTYYFKEVYIYTEPKSAITGGYLKGEENIDFILQHPEWNAETIEAAGKYFRTYGNRWNYFRLACERNFMKVKEEYLLALDFS